MFNRRSINALQKIIGSLVISSLLLQPLFLPGVKAESFNSQNHQSTSDVASLANAAKPKTPTPTSTVSPTPINACDLYPVALHKQVLLNARIGDTIEIFITAHNRAISAG